MKKAPFSFGTCSLIGFGIGVGLILFLYNTFIMPSKNAQISLLQQEKESLQSELRQAHDNIPISQITKPNLKITLLGGQIFVPTEEKELTGIALNLRIRNTGGTDSIATDWKLTIKTSKQTLKAEPMKAPPILTLTGSKAGKVILRESDFTFEDEVAHNPLIVGAPPKEGWLLFYVKAIKEEILAKDTVIELTVDDVFGNTSLPGVKKLWDWIYR